ncbi:ankyrin repeat-containing domain protein [Colletotrichum acutatum]|uniref:Ankyrin repeat-containing domain protein n=1 Tax=Glomerella acutata TaxID=27357 RepID=A0AAD8UR43_GLOAC|nr:ankyrin repeat-containing domain protein [Colletotrichum acutatum]KAK1725831.1 ankyrin repeat-containing domain protein [Colletotrichum acutatum]
MTEAQDRFPLHTAAREGKVSIAETILKTEPKLAAREDDDGRLPIHWAASSNCIDIVILLTQSRSFDPDVQDGSGWTPLMISASLKDGEDLVNLLLQKGADVNLKSDTAVALLKAGAVINKKDNDGCLPLDLAPDKEVRRFIERAAEEEGIEL